MRHKTVFLVFLPLLINQFAFAQRAQIIGRLTDKESGRPIVNASIFVNYLPFVSNSDSSGRFELRHIPNGVVELVVTSPGYKRISLNISIQPKAYRIDLSLEKEVFASLTQVLKDINSYREKVFVTTDKPYYYPREIIWMKAFLNYFDRTKIDSLSRLVYVELISSEKKIVSRQKLSLDSGRLSGQIVLPPEITPGNYLLRGYTNFMNNFGHEYFFYKSLPILSISQRKKQTPEIFPDKEKGNIKLVSNSQEYKPRSKVFISLEAKNGHNVVPAGTYSVSVVDLDQVASIEESVIYENWAFEPSLKNVPAIALDNAVEKGLQYNGQFLTTRDSKKKVRISMYRDNYLDLLNFETDKDGRFSVNGLKFYDSATFFFTTQNPKNQKEYVGKIVIEQKKEVATTDLVVPGLWFTPENTKSNQRSLMPHLLPPEVRLLDAVEIKSSRLENPIKKTGIRGGAQTIISANQLTNFGNLLLSLQGKVPGLQISCATTPCTVFFARSIGSSFAGTPQPLILVNDVPALGSAGLTLQNIDVNLVDRIEISNRLNVLYGEQGRGGIIAIYTKQGYDRFSDQLENTSFTLGGFDQPINFISPDYENPLQEKSFSDFRSTLYWNPELKIDPKTGKYSCWFFTSDLSGKYRIVLEGVTHTGDPIRAVSYLTIR